ncbi:MAG: hypothetical protein KF679_06385 [Chitinophagaceae bacterium]|nr:hypothetical protein [Chitinophagaceae bacterium]
MFKKDDELVIPLGRLLQKGSPFAVVKTEKLWELETFDRKVKSLFSLNWQPSEHLLDKISREVFYEEIFGLPSDYNSELFKINYWHNSREWNLSCLTDDDIKKADSLDVLAVALRNKHRNITSSYLHLHLFDKIPSICILLHPMVVKIPVTSIQYCVDIHNAFAYNEIRVSEIANTDDLISYIYELQNLQIKTALSLNELIYLIDYNEKNKGNALLIQAELSAISEAENIVNYLKATIEKIIVTLGLIYNLKNLETKKTHKSKLDALYKVIPEKVKQLFYFELIEELIKSESIEELNNFRTGLLHKKGISNLQPHSFVGQEAKDVPLKQTLSFLLEQHRRNSSVLISTYALLTDKLVEVKRPNVKFEELPFLE